MPADSQMQFDILDKSISKIRIVLLVQIGKEGWDCRIDAFTAEIKTMLELKEQKNNENSELTKLRDWLLPMLMNGQAAVSD